MTSPENSPLLMEKSGFVATVTLNDPPWNKIGLEFIDALEVRVRELAEDKSVRAVVFTAAGDANFSVGMNLMQLPQGIQEKGGAENLLDQRLRVLEAIETMGKPSVATLFGCCLGGGLELPLACHFRVAALEDAQIGLPELELGTTPAWGGTARLARTVGRDAALDMILRAKKISGPEAHRIGLVHEVWPNAELKERAHALAAELAAMPPVAVAHMLKALVGPREALHDMIAAERAAVLATMGTQDQAEGFAAFMEKRKPVFTGE